MSEKQFVLYEHVFPNGKRYIGISSNVTARWAHGYKTQGKMANAIKHYGWDNVKHNIIVDGLSKEQAETLEKYLIDALDTIDNGYNTAIGGDNINTTYLNANVLRMINLSKKVDKKYGYECGQKQEPDDIVSFCESGRTNKNKSLLINDIDDEINSEHSDYKSIYSGIHFIDGDLERCEAYFYYMREILKRRIEGKPYSAQDIVPYETHRFRFYFEGGVNDCEREV